MSVEPELIADYACEVGEGPLWHPTEQRIYWSDIPNGKLFRYSPETGQHEQCYSGEPVGGFTLQADGSLLLFMARGAIKVWRDGELTTIIEELADERESRFNDVIADPAGRVFCGTMPTPHRKGRLYRLDTDGTITCILEDIGVSNGMGFTLDRRQMYYTDTGAQTIYLFDYDQATGEISNQRVFAQKGDIAGYPDGMTVDARGHVWSARWDGNVLVEYAPDGSVVQTISFPARKVSSAIFGGPDYGDIYVTTAGGHIKEQDGALAGGLFRLRLPNIHGQAEFVSRILLNQD